MSEQNIETFFPTGKNHVSFSEISTFSTCNFKHHLQYVLGHKTSSIFLEFGNLLHASIDKTFKSNKHYHWISFGKNLKKYINKTNTENKDKQDFVPLVFDDWFLQGLEIYKQIFPWINSNFPGYKLYGSEIDIYCNIPDMNGAFFKGFIDLVIEHEGKYHIIDFKTTSWGWDAEKRSDTHKQYQLTLYKDFLCRRDGIDPKNVHTHFLLLKRTPPKKDPCTQELVTITSGPKKINNANLWLQKNANGIKSKRRLKNRAACRMCDFRNTKLCP